MSTELWNSVCRRVPSLLLTPASVGRSLDYLLKVRYIIVFDPNGARFLIFDFVFFCYGMETLPYV